MAGDAAAAGGWRDAPRAGQPTVLLFLSSKCAKCRGKLAEIAALAPAANGAGVDLWLVSTESGWRLRRFLAGSGLERITLRVAAKAYRRLNPQLSSPAYLFIDEHGALQAGGLVGDEDWFSFVEQMRDVDADADAAA
nr:redoxin domain-containing protein [Rugamonas sp. CCM 8940]